MTYPDPDLDSTQTYSWPQQFTPTSHQFRGGFFLADDEHVTDHRHGNGDDGVRDLELAQDEGDDYRMAYEDLDMNIDPQLGSPDNAALEEGPVDDWEWSQDEESDLGEEFYSLQSDVVKFQRNLQDQQRQGEDPVNPGVDDPGWKKGGRRGVRGPRKAVEPTLEIKLLLGRANEAFIRKDYDTAERYTTQVIQMNAETYAAHALLSGIFIERGEIQLGIVAQMSAAHLRPKHVSVWKLCVNLILENGQENRASYLTDAVYCYTRIVRINPQDVEARYQRALLLRELGHNGRAALEFEQMLELVPNDTTLLRHLAEVCIDLGEINRAIEPYHQHILHSMSLDDGRDDNFTWSDVNIFVELFGYKGDYSGGVRELKMLSRYLLGREQESYWDDVQEDDREWDLDDDPRRTSLAEFTPGQYGREAYGEGLPLELRVKLGLYRLKIDGGHSSEALGHFDWLEPENSDTGAKLFDYPDLFQEVADGLLGARNFEDAVRFYTPLQLVESHEDVQFLFNLARCYVEIGLMTEAEESYETIIQRDERNIEARIQLAKMYEALNRPNEAVQYVNEVLALERQNSGNQSKTKRPSGSNGGTVLDSFLPPSLHKDGVSRRQQTNNVNKGERRKREEHRKETVRIQYIRLQAFQERMKSGDEDATTEWMEAAKTMIEDFRTARVFYPWDRYIKFTGYSREARARALKPGTDVASALPDGLEGQLDEDTAIVNDEDSDQIPQTYRDIHFSEWLDVFLQYALCAARRGNTSEAYDAIHSAYDANIFYHSRDAVFLIHVCWAACGVLLRDDETICDVGRYLMKEYQFVTDAYRFHAALTRLCQGSNTWYNSGPSQKFILRQIKAMDYSLVSEDYRRKHFGEKGSYTSKDSKGNTIVNDDMDVALLVLYGHMLYAGTSFPYALQYFLRAYALDPTNPSVNLFIALSYIQYALKRQSANRHHLIIQGFTFLFAYYNMRQQSSNMEERQEGEFNVARAFHMLGLTHLAIPYYRRVLELSKNAQQRSFDSNRQDYAKDTAYNLQCIYSTAGNLDLAKELTMEYLSV